MKLKSKLLLGAMTPMERARGRYMRAPDHPTGGDNGSSSAGEGQADGNADPDAGLTTAQKLEKEFGQEITPATDNDGSSSDGSGDGDGGEDDGDADDAGNAGSDADADEGGAEGDAESGEEGGQPNSEEAKARKNRTQERISELTADARYHEREADKWRRRAEELGYVEGATATTEIPEEPDSSKYQYGENDLDYIRDKAKYDSKIEILTEQAGARMKAETAALEAKWSTTLAANEAKYPDFQEKVVKGAENWHCPPVIAVGIKDSEFGVDIAYKLASDPPEAERISKLNPLEQAREFGKLEAGFAKDARIKELEAEVAKLKGGTGGGTGKRPNIVTKAPEPPKRHVRGGGGKFETPADTDDFAAFDRMADAKLGIKHS